MAEDTTHTGAQTVEVLQKELEERASLLQATLDSTTDGILVADGKGKIVNFNANFVKMWHIPGDIIATKDDNKALEYVVSQLTDPEAFINKVRELYDKPESESYDVLEFKDGRTFERYSRPQRLEGKSVGRVWSFRDVTERMAAEAREKKRIEELETLNRSMVGRELKMAELKKRIAELESQVQVNSQMQ